VDSSSPAVGTLALPSAGKTTGNRESSLVAPQSSRASPSFWIKWNYIALDQTRNLTMSAPLVVSIPHRLGREEATRRLQAGLTRAASSIPVLKVDEERWEDHRMAFRVRALGQAASGHLDVADDHVRVEVTLPWLLQRFAEVAQAAIRNRGHLLLTKRGG
jgi:hypothetical protein